ncbi:hypothetical protein Tco_0626589 [Tanacetum coccineum]|uniref:Uncharacterized protein n=1 Tax=Tanacetum coccineum TaxID=301880 RepID=A0ABQ4WK41_9ASTR
MLKDNVFFFHSDGALMVATQEYMQKIVEDMGVDVILIGKTGTSSLQSSSLVSPNSLGDLNVTLKDLSDLVMSDSEESGITHTTVSSLYEDLSDIDPIDYPVDGGDDGDDEMDIEEDEDDDMDIEADEEDEDDEMDVKVDEEAEEEHPAPAYPVVVALPATFLTDLQRILSV